MAWIKRNLIFVITIVVGLGVTGYCGYLLYAGLADNEKAKSDYESAKGGLESLQSKTPYPSSENLQVAQADAERVREFLADFRKCFAGFPTPPKLGDRAFKDFLQKTIRQFGIEATNAGVGFSEDYQFSFSQQLDKLDYPPECIDPWLQQLEEIQAILRLLYDAKINYLESIKRPSTGPGDMGSDDVSIPSGTPSQLGEISSYEVRFRAFSTEVASVLAGIAGSSNCFLVKSICVEPSKVPLPQWTEAPATSSPSAQYSRPAAPQPRANPYMGGMGGGRPNMGGRPSMMGGRPAVMGGRPAMMPPVQSGPVAAAAPGVPAGPETILRETPLLVTLSIDVIKLNAPPAPPAAAKPNLRAP